MAPQAGYGPRMARGALGAARGRGLPAGLRRAARTVRQGAARVPGIAWIAAIGVLAWLLEPNAYVSYDYAFAISAAQDVFEGRATGYGVPIYSPVAHPLTILVALLTVPLGALTFPVFTAVVLLAFGLLVWSTFRLGSTVFNAPTGLLAAALVFLSPVIFELGVRTYGDVAFASLAVTAAWLEAARPRRGWSVMAILAAAGLLRPEAWALAGLYWLWLFPSRGWRARAGLAALAVVGPVGWSAMDWAMTGNLLHSITHTAKYTERTGELGLARAPGHVWTALTALMPWPVIVGSAAGVVFAWRRDRRIALIPIVLGLATFAMTVAPAVLGETPILRRYLIVPAAMLALFFAAAVLGWVSSPGRRARQGAGARGSRAGRTAGVWGWERRAWQAVGVALLIAVAFTVPDRVWHWEMDRAGQAVKVALTEDAERFATSEPAVAYLRSPACHPIYTPGYGYRPYLRYWLDIPPRDVAFSFVDTSPPRGAILLPTSSADHQRRMLADVGRTARANVLADPDFDRRYQLVASDARWELYADARCRATG